VEFGIDIVWPALERLYLVSLLHKQRHQSSGDGRFARAAHGCRDEKLRLHDAKVQKYLDNYVLFKKYSYLCTQILAIWRLMPPDVRESGENPELYLQL
jgi:hypothetical protein